VTVIAVVPAAGTGERLGADVPKAFVRIGGRELLLHAVDRLFGAGVDRIVVAVAADQLESARAMLGPSVIVVAGGADRTASVSAALAVVDADADVVLVHDAARAFAPESLIRSVVAAVRAGAPAVIPVLPVVDTVRSVTSGGSLLGTVDRDQLRMVQTPQGFSPVVLRQAHATAEFGPRSATDDAGLVEAIGVLIQTVPGDRAAFKVTTPNDCCRRSG
jgi:2-C-methyl-D-erythritol 4-phosphate cytidylyltransferase